MEINDEASAVHLFQHRVRIDSARAGPIESHFRNAAESDAWPDEHDHGIWRIDESFWRNRDERGDGCEPVRRHRFHDVIERNNDADVPAGASDWSNVDLRTAAMSTVIGKVRNPFAEVVWRRRSPPAALSPLTAAPLLLGDARTARIAPTNH
jgi:hypothetical protein